MAIDISNNYWWKYWGNIMGMVEYCNVEKLGKMRELKYMKDFNEKPSIYNKAGIKDYILSEGYTTIRVYSE